MTEEDRDPAVDDKAVEEAKQRLNSTLQRIISRHPSPETMEVTDEVLRHVEEESLRAKRERAANVRKARLAKWDEKVPAMWRGWSIELLPKGFKVQALDWLANGFSSGQNVVITGGTGSGKTTLSYAIAREVYAEGHKAKMWDVKDLISALNPKAPDVAGTLDSVKKCALLTIDDIGSEKRSEWTTERLLEIIDHRWQWKLPTIVTTNLPTIAEHEGDPDLRSHLGDRTYSRLMDGALWVHIDAEDRRENG